MLPFTAYEDILNNILTNPPVTDKYTKELLWCQINHPQFERLPTTFVASEVFKNGWKKMKEKTSSPLSGLYLGHHTAYTLDIFIACITGVSHISWKNE